MAKSAEKPFELANRLALRPAEALGIGERKLRELLPELPHIYMGSAVVIPIESLRAWLRKEASRPDQTDAMVDEILKDLQ